jgi:hypothetical protein
MKAVADGRKQRSFHRGDNKQRGLPRRGSCLPPDVPHQQANHWCRRMLEESTDVYALARVVTTIALLTNNMTDGSPCRANPGLLAAWS